MNFKQIHIDGELNPEELCSGAFIWIIHADKIPPHIGFSVDGCYFSLKVKGVDFGVDVNSVIRVIQKKKIKTLFLHVANVTLTDARTVFSNYQQAKANEVTCLAPLRELMHFVEAKRIHDLIDFLEQTKRILSCKSLYVPANFTGLAEYSEQDIHDRLKYMHES